MQRLSITIEDQLKAVLNHIAGKGKRAAFISRAIQKAVDDWHRKQALKRILDFKPYKIDQDLVEILREVREGRIQQVLQASQQ